MIRNLVHTGTARHTAIVIAIDGPAGAGKGTLARRLATHLGYAYLDTGLLYRAVGARVLRLHGHLAAATTTDLADAANAISISDLATADLRSDEIALAASKVAAVPEVRDALLHFQRTFARCPPNNAGGAILDGRDIGTVVWPQAQLKLFVTASVEVRGARRVKELRARGHEAIHADVLRDMQERDGRDKARSISPLVPAEDALIIDTSDLTPDAVFATAIAYLRAGAVLG